jgi:hypothetical protein
VNDKCHGYAEVIEWGNFPQAIRKEVWQRKSEELLLAVIKE